MSVFKCKMCGGTVEFNKGDTVGVCQYCGTKQTVFYFDEVNRTPTNRFTIIQKPDYNVSIKELVENEAFINDERKSVFALGKDYEGNPIYEDLDEIQHLLITGASGFGKSNLLRSIVYSFLSKYRADELNLLLIDPKGVELTVCNGLPHLLVPVVSDPRKAVGTLGWAVSESVSRLRTFSENNVRDIEGYNNICGNNSQDKLPPIVIIIDDYYQIYEAVPNMTEDSVLKLLQNGRACGIHLIITTSQVTKKLLPEKIKNSFPSKASFVLNTKAESVYILDRSCAERLTVVGDMLYSSLGGSGLKQIKCGYTDDNDIKGIVDAIKSTIPPYDETVLADIEGQGRENETDEASDGSDTEEMLPKAIEVVVENQKASTTLLQNKLKLGYAKAARLIDELEERGIIGPFEGSKPRKVLISKQQWYEMNALASVGTVKKTKPIENVQLDDIIQQLSNNSVQPPSASPASPPSTPPKYDKRRDRIVLNHDKTSPKNLYVFRSNTRNTGEARTYLYVDGLKVKVDTDRGFALQVPLGEHTIQFKRAALTSDAVKLDFSDEYKIYTVKFNPKVFKIDIEIE